MWTGIPSTSVLDVILVWMPIHSKTSRSTEDSGTCKIIQWHPAMVETDHMLEDSLTLCVCCFELDVCCTWSNIEAVHVGI